MKKSANKNADKDASKNMNENKELYSERTMKFLNGIGKPEFRRKLCQSLIEYFDIEPYDIKEQVDKHGCIWEKRIPKPLPLLAKFAVDKYKTSECTMRTWRDRYPEIKQAWEMAKDLQQYILITNSLLGLYDSRTAIFAMKNILGWRDKIEQKISGELSVTNLMKTISENNAGRDLMTQRDNAVNDTGRGDENKNSE